MEFKQQSPKPVGPRKKSKGKLKKYVRQIKLETQHTKARGMEVLTPRRESFRVAYVYQIITFYTLNILNLYLSIIYQ